MAMQMTTPVVDTQELTAKARRSLLQHLEAVRGKKNLVIEQSLAGTIGLIVTFKDLQEYSVDRLFFLENHNVDSSQRNIVFLVRGENAKKVRMIAEQIKLVRSESKIDHDFTIIWVPRRTRVSNLILEEHGVLGEANITHWPLHFVPLRPDLLSLELEDAFSDLYLCKDPTSIYASATALMLLQKQYGLFPRILGKGDNAKRLAQLLQRMRNEEDVNDSANPNNTYLASFGLTPSAHIENLIIIDREVDFPTLLSNQLTYEGLLDEVYGVSNNAVEIDSSVFGGGKAPAQTNPAPPKDSINSASPPPASATKRKIVLSNDDKLYPTLRNSNFATVGPLLNQHARRLELENKQMRSSDQSVAEMTSTVRKLKSYQDETASLGIHTSIAQAVMGVTSSEAFSRMLEVQQNLLAGADAANLFENIDELIARGDTPLVTVLRLLCLASTLSNGLRARDLDHYRREILQAYGFQHALTLSALAKMDLLTPRESHKGYLNPIAGTAGQGSTDWTAVRKTLRLWLDDVRESAPEDIAYVFSGYAPLSVRLVQCVLQKSLLHTLANNPPSRHPTADRPSTTTTASTAAPLPASSTTTGSTSWKPFDDVLSRLRGATIDISQKGSDPAASHARQTLRGARDGPKVSIVFFLGGVTYAEIAALRFVSEQLQESSGRSLIIATTGVVNGKMALEAAVEKRTFGEGS